METQANTNQTQNPDQNATHHCSRNGKGRRRGVFVFTLVIALIAGLAGGYIGKSFAHGGPGHAHGSLPADPAQMDQHIERMIQRFAAKVDASAEQKEKLAVIAKSAAKDLAPLREQAKSARKQALALLAGASVDRSAIELLRAEQMQLADTASKRLTQALADTAEVLTPEQRTQLAERLQRGHHRGGWHRG